MKKIRIKKFWRSQQPAKELKPTHQSKTHAKKFSTPQRERRNKENRHLMHKKVGVDFVKPLDLVSKYKGLQQQTPHVKCGASVPSFEEVALCRKLANEVLTYYEQLAASYPK